MKKRYFSIDRLVWGLILLAWSIRIASLLYSRNIYNYLHPKMTFFAVGAMIVFLILGLERLTRLYSSQKERFPPIGYLVFLAPLLFSLMAGTQALGASALSTRLLNTGSLSQNQGSLQIQRSTRTAAQLLEQTGKDEVLHFEDGLYAELFFDLAENLERYEGRLVRITGFVHRTANLQSDQVFITRLLITCCAADSDPLGVLAEGPMLEGLAENRWLTVEGRIGSTEYRNPYTNSLHTLPLLIISEIAYDTVPAVQYIYPPASAGF